MMRLTRLTIIVLAALACLALAGSNTSTCGQSIDETYDATRSVYLVSFFPGKLYSSLMCFLTWRLKSTLTLSQLAFNH